LERWSVGALERVERGTWNVVRRGGRLLSGVAGPSGRPTTHDLLKRVLIGVLWINKLTRIPSAPYYTGQRKIFPVSEPRFFVVCEGLVGVCSLMRL
jgi:hypothetical protein